MFLGVDSGGTKTALRLISERSDVVAQTDTEGTCSNRGIELVARVLREGVTSVCAQAQISPREMQYAFFGLPGYGEIARDIPALEEAPHHGLLRLAAERRRGRALRRGNVGTHQVPLLLVVHR